MIFKETHQIMFPRGGVGGGGHETQNLTYCPSLYVYIKERTSKANSLSNKSYIYSIKIEKVSNFLLFSTQTNCI